MRSTGLSRPALVLAILLCLTAGACGPFRLPTFFGPRRSSLEVVARTNRLVLTVGAEDIVNMMLGIGFTPQQVLDLCEGLRNALMLSGAAEIRLGKQVQAIFRVEAGDYIWIATHRGDIYVYDARYHRFGLREGQPLGGS